MKKTEKPLTISYYNNDEILSHVSYLPQSKNETLNTERNKDNICRSIYKKDDILLCFLFVHYIFTLYLLIF